MEKVILGPAGKAIQGQCLRQTQVAQENGEKFPPNWFLILLP